MAIVGMRAAFAQGVSARPDATVVIKEDASTAEMVEITMLKPDVPESVMRLIVSKLGTELKMEPRGFPYYTQRFGPRPQDQFVKARVAVAGLIDRQAGLIVLQPLARAFAGLPKKYEVRAIQATFEGESPTPRTVRTYASEHVVVSGDQISNPLGLQYLIAFRTQEADKIEIPAVHNDQPAPQPAQPVSNPGVPSLFWWLIALASLAGGWLVYLVLGSRSAKKRE